MNAKRLFGISVILLAALWLAFGGPAFPRATTRHHLGYSVSGGCDLDGDETPDLVVGAPRFDFSGMTDAGKVYVFSGSDGDVICILEGENSYDDFGFSVSCGGDFNNDDTVDFIVGAPGYDSNKGKVYVYSGVTFSLLHTFVGETAGDRFGFSVSDAGYANNDGYEDLIVGAPGADYAALTACGKIYLYHGGTWTERWDDHGEEGYDSLGYSVSGGCNINDDGYDDVIVGAPYFDSPLKTDNGRAYGLSGNDGALLCWPTGEQSGDHLGWAVSCVGHFDADSKADFIVGAPLFDGEKGKAYVLQYAPFQLEHVTVLCNVPGAQAYDHLGWSVSGAGDVNNDGKDDVVIGAPGVSSGRGKAYVHLGDNCGFHCDMLGENQGDKLGFSVSSAGDVGEGDNRDDLIVGAPLADPLPRSGNAYVYSGLDCDEIFEFEPVYHSVTYPNGGEICCTESTICVIWTGCSCPGNVTIDLLTESGDHVLTESTPNDGEFCLIWPCAPSESCRVEISDASTGDPYAESQSDFTTYRPGDANADCAVEMGDLIYLLNYLFQGGPPPYPFVAGDVNCNGVVDLGDVVYLQRYLFMGGPPPLCCEEGPLSCSGSWQSLDKDANAATVRLGPIEPVKGGSFRIPLEGASDVELAALGFEISYDPQEVNLLEPALTSRTEGLQVFSSAKEGIQRIGVIDVNGQSSILVGEGPLIMLRGRGSDFSSIRIEEATLVDKDAGEIRVEIVAQADKDAEGSIAKESVVSEGFSLFDNYPNPFNPETVISYSLPIASEVELSVYNLLGQKVRTLVDEHQAAGHRTVRWDGTDQEGRSVTSGIYFLRIRAGDAMDARKMILMR